ncbi:hypothetical protein TH53_01090 [Pedobacter lusitanus]|uniref:Uncharacterized protein n=1 Tax=Pedobacter lusitanus TaxID=1503925 RepID=A0A0D0GWX8_9SPHI|nr:hypothetical protein TH53_01090 [Pedobacter lusitanus]
MRIKQVFSFLIAKPLNPSDNNFHHFIYFMPDQDIISSIFDSISRISHKIAAATQETDKFLAEIHF